MEEMKFVVIRDMSAGNASVGEMWQETMIFDGNTPLKDVMEWAEGEMAKGEKHDSGHSKRKITITRPCNVYD